MLRVVKLSPLMRICHGLWEPSECSKSSTWRELTIIEFSLEMFAPVLKGWLMDSQSAAKFVESAKHEIKSVQTSCQNYPALS